MDEYLTITTHFIMVFGYVVCIVLCMVNMVALVVVTYGHFDRVRIRP